MDRETDEIIYSRFLKDGKSDDLRQLLERHRESLTLFIYGFVRNMEDAEDIMLNAFAVTASGGAAFSGKSSFKTWLFGIARNLARKHIRKTRSIFGTADSLEAAVSHEEVAGVMHKSVKQVYNLVFRGKQALKKILEGSELENAQY